MQSRSIKILTLFIAIVLMGCLGFNALAVVNEEINYQGKLTNASGVAVADGEYCMKFVIYDTACSGAPCSGSALWTEEWNAGSAKVDITSGLFSVMLGSQITFDSAGLNFDRNDLYLEVSVDATCADSYETLLPRKRLGVVPAALTANALEGYTWAAPGSIGATTPATGTFSYLSVGSAYSFPASAGSANQFLGYDGSGTFGWNTISVSGYVPYTGATANLISSYAAEFDGGFLSTGTTTAFTIPSGAGTRMMWIPSLGAFRAGQIPGAEWNSTNIGTNSTAFGYMSAASGAYSFAVGHDVIASNSGSVSMGYSANSITSSGIGSFAMGYTPLTGAIISSGSGSVAMGFATYGNISATGTGAVAIGAALGDEENGKTLTATGTGAVAMGQDVNATGNNTLVFGKGLSVSTASSFNVGFGTDITTPDFQVTADNVKVDGTLSITNAGAAAYSFPASAGSANQFLGYDGSGTFGWNTISVSGYVPYTGATSDVDLGSHNLTTTGTITGGTLAVGSAYSFPTSAGSASQFLGYDATGTLGWNTVGVSYNSSGDVIVSPSGSGDPNILSDTGVLVLGGNANTNNENLTFDFEATSNQIGINSTTGVTELNFNGLSVTSTGTATFSTLAVGSAYTFPTSAGSASQFLGYDATGTLGWNTISVSGYVPYTGATSDVDLGSHNLTTTGYGRFDTGILATGTTTGFTIPSGEGTRLMWIPSKYAFRAGIISAGAEWDSAKIGNYSAAFGNATTASGSGSFAAGLGTQATKNYSTAFGNYTTASGISSFAAGDYTSAGSYAAAFGSSTRASGSYSAAFGDRAYATGNSSLAFGILTTASGQGSFAGGYSGTPNPGYLAASGQGSFIFGASSIGKYMLATGTASFAMGQDVNALNNNTFTLGKGLSVTTADSFNVGFGTDITTPDFQVTADNVKVDGTLSITNAGAAAYSFPTSAGSASQFLGYDATGTLGWNTITGGSMTYPSAGIAVSTGSAWAASIADNSTNWDSAYSAMHTQGTDSSVNSSLSGVLFATSGTLSTKAIGTDIQAYHANLASLSGLTYSSASFVKMTASGTFDLDTNTYMANPMNAIGQIIYGGASGSATALAAGLSGQILQSGGGGAPAWTTTTYPATITSGQVLYATADNAIGATSTFTFDGSNLEIATTGSSQLLSGDGILILGGFDQTNNENLTFDFETTSNQIGINSTTGVTELNFNGLGIVSTGTATFGLLNTAVLYNSAGGLKIQPDVQGDVTLFGDTDVGDTTDGKSLYVYRRAAEGDVYGKMFVSQYNSFNFSSNSNILFGASGYVRFNPTGETYMDIGNGGHILVRADAGAGATLLTINDDTGNTTWNAGGNLTTTGTGSFGIVNIPATTSATGQITQAGASILHTFEPAGSLGKNLFVGLGSGNFTMAISGQSYHAEANVGIGYNTLHSLTTGYSNVGIGKTALQANTTGYNNVGVGKEALITNTSGHDNFALGRGSLYYNSSGNYNVMVGSYSGQRNTTGASNVGIGYQSLVANKTGSGNVAFGDNAGKGVTDSSDVSYNTFIGYQTGYSILTGGDNNIFLGSYAGYRQTTNANLLIIDNQQRADVATEASNAIIYGLMASTPASQTLAFNVGSANFGAGNISTTGTGTFGALTIGSGAAGVDYNLTFNGETSDGVLTWMEDEGYLKIEDGAGVGKIFLGKPADSYMYFGSLSNSISAPGGMLISSYENIEMTTSNGANDGVVTINGDLYVTGKVDAIGGVDPPYMLFDLQTRASITQMVDEKVSLGKRAGATMFFNSQTNKMEIFIASEGKFYDLSGNLLGEGMALESITKEESLDDAGAVGSGSVSGLSSFSVKTVLKSLGMSLSNGVATLKEVVADKINVKLANVETLQMVDKTTGEVYCTWIEDGEWKKIKGECSASIATASISTPIVTESEVSSTTAQQISELAEQAAQSAATAQAAAESAQSSADSASSSSASSSQAGEDNESEKTEKSKEKYLTISSVAPISDISVENGTELSSSGLPGTVTVTLSDSTTKDLAIIWNNGDPTYNATTSGEYNFVGMLTPTKGVENDNNYTATCKIIVKEAVVETPAEEVATESESEPELENPVEEILPSVGEAIQETTSSLLNGIWEFLKWMLGTSSKEFSELIPDSVTLSSASLSGAVVNNFKSGMSQISIQIQAAGDIMQRLFFNK